LYLPLGFKRLTHSLTLRQDNELRQEYCKNFFTLADILFGYRVRKMNYGNYLLDFRHLKSSQRNIKERIRDLRNKTFHKLLKFVFDVFLQNCYIHKHSL
jgi:hypothetical protein